jgi:hypothetical protein
MEVDETFKYLGIEGDGIDNSRLKDALVKEYFCWVQQILMTVKIEEQNHSFNTLAVPVLVYSFRIIIWLRKEIEKIV